MAEASKRSHVEDIKEASVYLKGTLSEELADASTPFISEDNEQLIKHHGSYQQYDRDTATERKKAGLEKEWSFMVRVKCPGGRMTAEQYLKMEELAATYANGTLRITTRETFQFHGILKGNMKAHIAGINHALLTTLGGCGDVVRNIMCTPAPIKDAVHDRILADTRLLAKELAPKTSAYHEIWLDGENVARVPENESLEPLYGKYYLPRKFKIAVGVAEDNSVDMLTHDLALVQIWESGMLKGYNIYMGGGLGMTHNKPETYPRLASPIAYIEEKDFLRGAEAVVKLQRDHGDRSNRKHARLKYVVEEKGIAWTRQTLEEYFGAKLQDPKPTKAFAVVDHMGWHEQKDGKWYLGIPVSSGRIADRGAEKILSGLHHVISTYKMPIVLTADQNIILCDIAEKDKAAVTKDLKSFGIKLNEDVTNIYRNFLACVALPTCGLALAEAERAKLPLVEEIEKVMEKHGILSEKISIRMTGCPNGCARPYAGDIGIVGRMPGHYALYIGGDFDGTRLNTKVFDRVPFENLTDVFDVLFEQYAAEKKPGEGFGDFAHRKGVKVLASLVEARLSPTHKWAKAA